MPELTWKEIRTIVKIADNILKDPGYYPESEQSYYEEVLKRVQKRWKKNSQGAKA